MAVNICNMEEKDRIEKIMREENMTLSQFSLEIGVQQSTLSHILSGRNKMSAAVMKQILNRFPTISSDWLILDSGPMRRQKSNSQSLDLFSASPETAYPTTPYAPEEAEKKVTDPLYLGCLMIKNGDADGQLAGARNTTGNVLRPALQIIKTAPGITCVSGAMLLLTHAPEYGTNGIVVMGDVAVTPVPDASQLAQIAVCTARTANAVAGLDPKVALLSFSTKGSAKHDVVDKVVEALKLAKEMAPDIAIDGELQADAALVPEVGASKAPGSAIAGHANVLVVPNLEVGNISYKLVQRLGHADAIGPILQGIARPVNDLSRGCSVEDVYRMIAITANQAIAAKNNA